MHCSWFTYVVWPSKKSKISGHDLQRPYSLYDQIVANTRIHNREVIKDIRKKPGFEYFQLPYISDENFQALSRDGPVIMLIAGVGDVNGTAFCITDGTVCEQSLVGYSQKECEKQYTNLVSCIKQWQATGHDDGKLYTLLSWLWYKAAEPVLRKLGFAPDQPKVAGQKLPRICWILCDWTNRLPIHAAGDYRNAEETGLPLSVMDCAVSSYSPTLRTLMYSRARMSKFGSTRTASQHDEVTIIETPAKDINIDSGETVPQPQYRSPRAMHSRNANPQSHHNASLSAQNATIKKDPTTDVTAVTDTLAVQIRGLNVDEKLTPETPLALLAAMPTTPDHPPLPNALTEITRAASVLSPFFEITSYSDPAPTRKDIIKGLQTCTIAHLACHGDADPLDPLRSKLLLSDWGPKPLRVSFLMRMEMRNCQLAYLSACKTAVNHDHQLSEEALHVCGAFQVAGVPNVIATLWEILDEEACSIAGHFYAALRGGEGTVDVGRSAKALHEATMKARKAGMSPFVWAGYAHFGA